MTGAEVEHRITEKLWRKNYICHPNESKFYCEDISYSLSFYGHLRSSFNDRMLHGEYVNETWPKRRKVCRESIEIVCQNRERIWN